MTNIFLLSLIILFQNRVSRNILLVQKRLPKNSSLCRARKQRSVPNLTLNTRQKNGKGMNFSTANPLGRYNLIWYRVAGNWTEHTEFVFYRGHRIIKFKYYPKRLCKVFKCQWVKILTMRAHCLNRVKFHKEIPWIGLGRFVRSCSKMTKYHWL